MGPRNPGFVDTATYLCDSDAPSPMTKLMNLVSFLVAVIKSSDKSSLMDKGLILPQFKVRSTRMMNLRQGAVEAADRLTAVVRRQRDECIHTPALSLLSSPYTIQDLQPREWFYPRWPFFLPQLM